MKFSLASNLPHILGYSKVYITPILFKSYVNEKCKQYIFGLQTI